jgi:hypothetical protein
MRAWRRARAIAPLLGWGLCLSCLVPAASAGPYGPVGRLTEAVPAVRSQRAAESLDVVLAIDRHTASAGGVVRVRVENRSSVDVVSNPRYALARRTNGSWVALPTGPFFAPQIVVRARTAGSWQSVGIPRRAVAGRYRVRKWVRAVGSRHPSRLIQATFSVSSK